MSLYIPPAFQCADSAPALALMRAWPFATLITSVVGSEPHITHLPLLLDGPQLTGHLARANPHAAALFAAGSHTIAVFHGPHAYVSPRWYVEPAREVPTWNFATVHVQGQPQAIDDAARKRAVLEAISATFEPAENPWTLQLEGARLAALIDHIVAFHLPLTRIEAKFKLNQNKTAPDRAHVAAQLRSQSDSSAAAVAQLMQRFEPVP